MRLIPYFKISAITLAMLPLAALLIAWLGPYNIAASAGHPAWLDWFLDLGKTSAIESHSRGITPPAKLQDIDRIRLGASHFAIGCAECHGTPGREINPVYAHMLPAPPDLARRVARWETHELYWIVRHGLQFTGMPGWSGGQREDELWSMVAFLLALPELSGERYRRLAAGNMNIASVSSTSEAVAEVLEGDVVALVRTVCERCHDTAFDGPPSALVPRLAGQSAEYIERSLLEYQRGERRSGFMQPVVAALDYRQIAAVAQYYSMLPSLAAASASSTGDPPQAAAAEAALLATGADQEQRIPACLSCHGAVEARDDYPRLAGQPAPYLAQQLRLFQAGRRQQSAWGEVMTVIARRLSESQIDALAHWFSRQPQSQTGEP